jgi:hypothetical protein
LEGVKIPSEFKVFFIDMGSLFITFMHRVGLLSWIFCLKRTEK